MDAVRATVPLRIDLAGGTIDVWPLPLALPRPVVTVNAALALPSTVTARRRTDGGIVVRSIDRGEEARFASRAGLERSLAAGRPALGLLLRAVAVAGNEPSGLAIETRTTAPAGAGLGGSSALLVALLAALDALAGRARPAEALLGLAQEIETSVLAGPTGYQDYYPPLLGGCLALEGGIGGPRVERLPVDLEALSRRLRLVWTAAPHVSTGPNGAVLAAWLRGEPSAVEGLEGVRREAAAAREGFRRGDLEPALAAVLREGALRRKLAPGVDGPATRAVDRAARQAGALGTKILGAGGGGCVLVVLPEPTPAGFDDALAAGPGQPLPLALTAEGLRIEEA
jgi:D-glycero-alpha-D-manno-heptose-7-phosphate kinase